MVRILTTTFQGVLRDRIFHGMLFVVIVFLFIPSASTFSLRQVTQLTITLSLGLTSFLLLLLAVFLGGTSLWRDLERRSVHAILGGTPINRRFYLLGKYCGISLFIFSAAVILGGMCFVTVLYTSTVSPPERPVLWLNIVYAVFFDALKYTLLVAVAFLLSTVSTSFFLPIFGAIATFLAGSSTQEVYDYLQTDQGTQLPVGVKSTALFFYYLLPNFSAFDLKSQAIYSIPHASATLLLTLGYAVVYIAILLTLASLLFNRRELL